MSEVVDPTLFANLREPKYFLLFFPSSSLSFFLDKLRLALSLQSSCLSLSSAGFTGMSTDTRLRTQFQTGHVVCIPAVCDFGGDKYRRVVSAAGTLGWLMHKCSWPKGGGEVRVELEPSWERNHLPTWLLPEQQRSFQLGLKISETHSCIRAFVLHCTARCGIASLCHSEFGMGATLAVVTSHQPGLSFAMLSQG